MKNQRTAELRVVAVVVLLTVGLGFASPARTQTPEKLFQEGLRNYYRENLMQARRSFQKAVRSARDRPRYHFFLGNVFARQDKFEQAELAYQKSLELDTGYTTARRRLAFLYFKKDRWQDAAEQFNRLLKDSPRDYEYRFHHAVCLFNLGELDAARDEFFRARDLQRDSPEVFYYLGRLSMKKDEYSNAANRFSRALELSPSNGRYYFYRGLARFRNEDYKMSAREWRSANDFKKAAESGYDNARTRFLHGNSLLCRGLYLLKKDQTRKGIDHLQNAVSRYRKVLVKRSEASNTYHNLGVAYLGIGKLDLALEALRRAVNIEPEVPFFHDSLGLVHFRRGNFERALNAWSFVNEIETEYSGHPLKELLAIESFEKRRQEARIRR